MNKKKSDKTKEAFLEQLRKTPILQIACEKIGIHRMSAATAPMSSTACSR